MQNQIFVPHTDRMDTSVDYFVIQVEHRDDGGLLRRTQSRSLTDTEIHSFYNFTGCAPVMVLLQKTSQIFLL